MGNTRPSRMCVIQEYWFYTMSLSLYNESLFIPWVQVYTMSLSLYHESFCISCIQYYTMRPSLYHNSKSISGSGDPEPKFGETFGFALFHQGLVLFARFLPVFAHFLPSFTRVRPFLPHFAPFLLKNASFLPVFCPFFARFCPVLPGLPGLFGFAQICQNSFVFVRRAHAQFATPWSISWMLYTKSLSLYHKSKSILWIKDLPKL